MVRASNLMRGGGKSKEQCAVTEVDYSIEFLIGNRRILYKTMDKIRSSMAPAVGQVVGLG